MMSTPAQRAALTAAEDAFLVRDLAEYDSFEAARRNRQVQEQLAGQPAEVMNTPVRGEPATGDHTAGTQAGCGAQGQMPETPAPDTPDLVNPEGNKRKFPTDPPTICPTGVPTGETAASRDENNGSELWEGVKELNTNPVEKADDHEGTTAELAVTHYHTEGSAIPTAMPTTAAPTT